MAALEEIELLDTAVRETYKDLLIGPFSRLKNGNRLWESYEAAIAKCRSAEGNYHRAVTERVNEFAVAKALLGDPTLKEGNIAYEPDFLPDRRRIDFVADRKDDKLFIEVKTVHPTLEDTEHTWEKYVKAQEFIPENVEYRLEKKWLGGALYQLSFASRVSFLSHAMEFETRLKTAKETQKGVGILFVCGNGGDWHLDELEDFVDFYLDGQHRSDDPFSKMELHTLKTKGPLLRNIDHFAAVRRPDWSSRAGFHYPVRGMKAFRADWKGD